MLLLFVALALLKLYIVKVFETLIPELGLNLAIYTWSDAVGLTCPALQIQKSLDFAKYR
jgi:hypothetical protein